MLRHGFYTVCMGAQNAGAEEAAAKAAVTAALNVAVETATHKHLPLGLGCLDGFHSFRRLGVLLLKSLDAARGVQQLLLSGEEWVAVGADFDQHHIAFEGRAGLKGVAAGAVNHQFVVIRMNSGFHERSHPPAGLHGLPPERTRAAASLGRRETEIIRERARISKRGLRTNWMAQHIRAIRRGPRQRA